MNTTVIEEFIEFRCGTCYQLRYEPTNAAGEERACPYCSSEMAVPAAEPSRIRKADEIEQVANLAEGVYANNRISNADIDELTRQRVAARTRGSLNSTAVAARSCGRGSRILAYFVDVAFFVFFFVLNLMIGHLLSSTGLCVPAGRFLKDVANADPMSLCCYFGIVGLVQLAVWWSISVYGASPGKFAINIRIVNSEGQPPGFFRGVVLRSFVAGILFNLLPILTLIDYLSFFLGQPPRCVHDHIAGTWVIDRIG